MRLVEKPHTVYVLRDPRNKQVRYVGVTSRALNLRVSNHIADASHETELVKQHGDIYKSNASNKVKWITELRLLGLSPLIEPVETVHHSRAIDCEEAWINLYLNIGCDLTNSKRYHHFNPNDWKRLAQAS